MKQYCRLNEKERDAFFSLFSPCSTTSSFLMYIICKSHSFSLFLSLSFNDVCPIEPRFTDIYVVDTYHHSSIFKSGFFSLNEINYQNQKSSTKKIRKTVLYLKKNKQQQQSSIENGSKSFVTNDSSSKMANN